MSEVNDPFLAFIYFVFNFKWYPIYYSSLRNDFGPCIDREKSEIDYSSIYLSVRGSMLLSETSTLPVKSGIRKLIKGIMLSGSKNFQSTLIILCLLYWEIDSSMLWTEKINKDEEFVPSLKRIIKLDPCGDEKGTLFQNVT